MAPFTPRSLDGGIDEIPLPAEAGGRLYLCGKHVVGPDPVAALGRVRASTIVCLNEGYELEDRYPEYVGWLRANAGGPAVWFPVPDLHAPTIERVEPFLDALVARLQGGEDLLVHCGAGIGRAGTTAVALLLRFGMALDPALAHVRAHRPMAGPEAGAQWLLVDALARRTGREGSL